LLPKAWVSEVWSRSSPSASVLVSKLVTWCGYMKLSTYAKTHPLDGGDGVEGTEAHSRTRDLASDLSCHLLPGDGEK
jgi:hypothetical protein